MIGPMESIPTPADDQAPEDPTPPAAAPTAVGRRLIAAAMGAATWVLIALVTDAILRAIGIVISPDGTIGTLAFLFPLVVGAFVAGVVARARTARDWVLMGVLTFVFVLALGIAAFVIAVSLE